MPSDLMPNSTKENRNVTHQFKTQITRTVQLRDKRPRTCVRNARAKFVYMHRHLSVHAFPTRLISMYESAYCLLHVLILLLVLAAVYCKSMAR